MSHIQHFDRFGWNNQSRTFHFRGTTCWTSRWFPDFEHLSISVTVASISKDIVLQCSPFVRVHPSNLRMMFYKLKNLTKNGIIVRIKPPLSA